MQFPKWVHSPAHQPKSVVARKRLNYLLNRAALHTVEGGSITEFAKQCGIDRSSLHKFVNMGEFSPRSAVAIEQFVGRDHTPYEYLIKPLDIEAE